MCAMCKGKTKQDKTDYVESNENHVVLVRDVPCEKCAQCGETYLEHSVVLVLERIMNQIQRISGEISLTVIDYAKKAA